MKIEAETIVDKHSDSKDVIIYWPVAEGLQGSVYTAAGVEIPGTLNFSGQEALNAWAREQGLRPVPIGTERKWGKA